MNLNQSRQPFLASQLQIKPTILSTILLIHLWKAKFIGIQAMTTTCRFDQLVWFRSDARARWWPAIYYESHLAAASDLAKINLAGIDESQQIALIYQYLQEQGGDSPPQPIVQLITGQPPATRTKGSFKFAHVTDPSTQLQRDFLQQLVQISQEPYATTDEEFRNALNEVRALIQTLRQSTVKVPSTTPTIVKEQNKPRVNVRFNTNTSITTNHSSIQATDHDHDIAMVRTNKPTSLHYFTHRIPFSTHCSF
jgi:hypothetical protein